MSGVQPPKNRLREELLSARLQLEPNERARRSRAACERIAALPAFREARTVAVYAATGAEADPATLTSSALSRKKRIAFPRLDPDSRVLSFAACSPADLVPGDRGVRTPPPGAPPVALGELDLVVVPGVAFDLHGRRLGRGGGYYDATLALLPAHTLRVALAFDLQVVEEVPGEPHDVEVHLIATEARLFEAAPVRVGAPPSPGR
jgi:5-formyltetrahydrofolate cyclo-ligase